MTDELGGLEQQAERFAADLTAILNATVTVDVQVSAVVTDDEERAYVAVGATEDDPLAAEPIPLSTDPSCDDPHPWLLLAFRCRLDDEQRFLAVQSSKLAFCINPETKRAFIRVEFDRAKRSYPTAHIQITGSSEELGYAWGMAGKPPKRLQDVHIPVGGVRYRPSLEDFIEFLQAEELIYDLHDGWRGVIEEHRERYQKRQLRAAIRRDPETAAAGLEMLGYEVSSPVPGSNDET